LGKLRTAHPFDHATSAIVPIWLPIQQMLTWVSNVRCLSLMWGMQMNQ